MSTSAPDPTTSGSDAAFGYLLTTRIPEVLDQLIWVQEFAQEHGMKELQAAAAEISIGLLNDVNAVAVKSAGYADGAIIRKMFESHTSNRPITGTLESHVKSLPGPLGSVRVALIEELDKVVNPNTSDYGPFWRAQEYGTGQDGVPSQLDRVIFGTFENSGTQPNGDLRGVGVGHDIAFIPGGRSPGFGTITVELPARHFLRDGWEEAGVLYKEEMTAVQAKWIKRIEKLIELAVEQFPRRITFILDA